MSRARSLRARLKPVVDRLVREFTAAFEARIEAELERLNEAFEVALSSYESDAEPVAPVLTWSIPNIKDLHVVEAVERPTPAPREVPARQTNGKRPVTCQKCGYIGGNQRGCGTSHPTLVKVLRAEHKAPAAPVVDEGARVDRIKRVSIARSGQPATLGMRASRPTMPPRRDAEPELDDDTPERWSLSRIAAERELAEAKKHEGDLPNPRSSFVVDRGEVTELDFGDHG